MIAHALHILTHELNDHIVNGYSAIPTTATKVKIGNISLGVSGPQGGTLPADMIIITLVNYREEKTLKNVPHFVRNDAALKVSYENPPVFLNVMLLFSATHVDYKNAITDISRVFRFFQAKNVFTEDNVAPVSLSPPELEINALDQLASFKLIMELCSPSLEEVNHLWGTLGGKQFPFVMYMMRMLDLKYRIPQGSGEMITTVKTDLSQERIPKYKRKPPE